HRLPVAGIIWPVLGQRAGRVDGGVRVRAVGPGAAARLESHHERQPSLGQLGAEPVLVPVSAVGDDRAEREPRARSPDGQARADGQLGAERRVVFPLRKVAGRYGKTDNGVVTVTTVWADERLYYPV